MAYSLSPVTARAMLPYLEPLTKGEEAIWRVDAGRAHWLAKRLREALAAARANPEEFPLLAQADYRISIASSREVRGVPRSTPTIELLPASAPRRALVETMKPAGVEGVARMWETHGVVGKLHLPNAAFSNEELLALYEWSLEAATLLFVDVDAITILARAGNEDAAEFCFTPEDLEISE